MKYKYRVFTTRYVFSDLGGAVLLILSLRIKKHNQNIQNKNSKKEKKKRVVRNGENLIKATGKEKKNSLVVGGCRL